MATHAANCAYCGDFDSGCTDDHVVPRALWGDRPRPSSPPPVQVPVCQKCKGPRDAQASYFRQTLCLIVGDDHPVAAGAIQGPIFRGFDPRHKGAADARLADATRNMRPLPRRTSSGRLIEFALGFDIDETRYFSIPEKIVRGLFYHKSGVSLPTDYTVNVFFWEHVNGSADYAAVVSQMEAVQSLGDDVFQMRCVRDNTDHNVTAWLLEFYRKERLFAITSKSSS